MFGKPTAVHTVILRGSLLCISFVLVGVPTALFAGIGYFLLVFSAYHAVLTIALYRDSVYVALFGREFHSTQSQSIEKVRASRVNRMLCVGSNVGFFALAIVGLLVANVNVVEL